MLPRLPLRYLLADDPGAGKTIMAGMLIKELRIRGDVRRCLVVSPGNLAEQWQDEMYHRFSLPFDILARDRIASARTGNVFNELSLAIARLDTLARNDDLKAKLEHSDWDLIVVDEAHNMALHPQVAKHEQSRKHRGLLECRIHGHEDRRTDPAADGVPKEIDGLHVVVGRIV